MKETVKEYAESDLDRFPPITVARSDDEDLDNLLLAGFTRFRAFKMAGREEIPVVYAAVSCMRDAMEIAAGSNSRHGLRLQKPDLELAMIRLDKQGTERKKIAEILKVSPATVTRVLKPKRSPEEKSARKAALNDSSLSNKDAAKKLEMSPSAVSQARKKNRAEPQVEQATTDETDDFNGKVKQFQDEITKFPSAETSEITLADLREQASEFHGFLENAMETEFAPETVNPALISAERSIKRLIEALVDQDIGIEPSDEV
ncbi:MAG: helix-turn-helix domain-containing protein [Candidatus Ozemobacteraceae bacterium]